MIKLLIFCLYFTLINVEKFAETVDDQQWNDFKTEFGKNYATSEEEQYRMKVYQDNLDEIAKHNEKFKKGETTFTMGMNEYGDMTAEEFAKTHFFNVQPTYNLKAMSDAQQGKEEEMATSE